MKHSNKQVSHNVNKQVSSKSGSPVKSAQGKNQQLQQLAQRLSQLPDAKKQAFRQALQEKGIDPWKLPIVSHAKTAETDLPLSFAQQRLWFVEQMQNAEKDAESSIEKSNALYNLVFGLRFTGNLNIAAVEASIDAVLRRHEILRTTYHSDANGNGVQRVTPADALLPTLLTVETLPAYAKDNVKNNVKDNVIDNATDNASETQDNEALNTECTLNHWVQQQASQPFDLSRDVMFRFKLAQIGVESADKTNSGKQPEIIGLFVVHHIAFDFLSMELIVKEFSQLYLHYCQNSSADASFSSEEPALPIPALPIPALQIQYSDFAVWQREWAASNDYQRQKTYWLEQLSDAPARLELPSDFIRPARQSHKGHRVGVTVANTLSEQLRSLAKQQNVTLYMVLISAFNLLLNRYSQQDDICIGTSVANRSRPETAPLMGFFVNLLVMRNQQDPEQHFGEFLQQVNRTATQAYAHQDIPFDHLVDVLNIPRNASTSPLFQALFVLTSNDNNSKEMALPDLNVSAFHHDQGIARYELTLRANDSASQAALSANNPLFFEFEYNCDLFTETTIRNMLQQYQFLCEQICQQVGLTQPLNAFQLMPASVNPLMASPSVITPSVITPTNTDENEQGVQHLFETAASRYPEKPALVSEPVFSEDTNLESTNIESAYLENTNIKSDRQEKAANSGLHSLSYGELNAKANQLAHYLREQGIGRETTVALYMERSSALVIGLLAVLKAGGAYIPLDTKWPAQRINDLLAEAKCDHLLAESNLTEQQETIQVAIQVKQRWIYPSEQASLEAISDSSVTINTSVQQPWHNYPSSNPEPVNQSEDAAYIIFTSGSTGKPKGVVVEHRNIINYTRGVTDRLAHNERKPWSKQHFAHISTIAADLGNTVLYGALCAGGTLHLINNDRAFDPDAVADYLYHQQIDVLKIVPSHLQGLLSCEVPENILPDNTLILGGEACSPALLARIQHLKPQLRVMNHYGPSETTVGVLTHELPFLHQQAKPNTSTDTSTANAPTQRIPLGKPLPGTQVVVLDPYQHPCPVGVAGELYIAGASVSRGYLHRPDLTEERFVSLTFGEQTTRFYRTGDRVRTLANGDLEFIGRVDNQVKVRGYRVELGDIQAGLQQLPEVNDAWVTLAKRSDDTETDSAQLVAFVTVNASHNRSENKEQNAKLVAELLEAIREALAQNLPEYMVPSQIEILDSLPLTANGKIDTQTLNAQAVKLLESAHSSSSSNTENTATDTQPLTQPISENEQKLIDVIKQVLRREQVSVNDNFFELGGDSILSLQVIARAKRNGLKLTPKQFLEQATIGKLAGVATAVDPKSAKAQSSKTKNAKSSKAAMGFKGIGEQEKQGEQPIPLTPIQQWFFDTPHPEPHYWNQAQLFQEKSLIDEDRIVKTTLTPQQKAIAMGEAVALLVQHHPQLRASFEPAGTDATSGETTANTIKQIITPFAPRNNAPGDYFTVVNWLEEPQLNERSASEKQAYFESLVDKWQSSLSLQAKNGSGQIITGQASTGQLFKVVYFVGSNENSTDTIPDRLLIVAHHLIIDGVSWRILLDDLLNSYRAALNPAGEPDPFMQTDSFAQWSQQLQAVCTENQAAWLEEASQYWSQMRHSLGEAAQQAPTHPLAMANGSFAQQHPVPLSQVQHQHFTLSEQDTTALLQQAPKAYKTRINDLLLAALGLAFSKQQANTPLYLELEGHGREGFEREQNLDVSRTIGWFTSRFPVLIPSREKSAPIPASIPATAKSAPSQHIEALIKSSKETLRGIPLQGLAFGALKQFGSHAQKQAVDLPAPLLSFNYLGQMDADESSLSQLFEAVPGMPQGKDAGTERHPNNLATHWISINAMVSSGKLQVRYSIADAEFHASPPFKREQLNQEQLNPQQLGEDFMHALQSVIQHCGDQHLGYTPSDFPLAGLSQTELDNLLAAEAQTRGQVETPEHKQELIQDQLQEQIQDQIQDIYPMTPMQEGLMFHTLFKPNSGIYVMQYCYELQGTFNHNAFVQAGQMVVAQHPILRTSFMRLAERPMQIVHRAQDMNSVSKETKLNSTNEQSPVTVLDWREQWQNQSPETSQAQLQHWLKTKLHQGFNLHRPTQLAITLIQIEDDRYLLVRSFHHILMDAWCFSLLMNDFMRAYQGICAQKSLTEVQQQLSAPRPYRDYIAWLQRSNMNKAETFWRNTLKGYNAPTQLPIDYLHNGKSVDKTNSKAAAVKDHLVHLSEAQTQHLQTVAQQQRTTVNTLVQAAWGLLLSRYSNEQNVLFGVTVAGRPTDMEGADEILGLFINTIPLPLNVDPTLSAQAFMEQVWQTNHTIREYEFAPLTDIHRWSDFPPKSVITKSVTTNSATTSGEMFDTLFVFENAPLEYAEDTNQPTFELQGASNRTHTNYPITVVVYPKQNLGLQLTYDCSRFDDVDIARMLENFQHTLLNLAQALASSNDLQSEQNKEQNLGSIEIVPPLAQQQLLVGFNQTYTDYPREKCWQELFLEQVQQTPDAIAVRCKQAFDLQDSPQREESQDREENKASLTYKQLYLRSNHLAKRLLLADVQPNDVVAVLDERGLDLMVMMVAVLRAGAAYLPLDPKHPQQRMGNVIQSSQPKVILTGNDFQSQVLDTLHMLEEQGSPVASNLISFGKPDVAELSSNWNPASLNTSLKVNYRTSDLAYVIYTSGSTGLPKGAMVEHLGMLNNVYAKIPLLNLSNQDVIAQTASQCFDISVWQCLTGLICGATVQIYPDAIAHDPGKLLAHAEQDKVTILESVPSLIQSFIDIAHDAQASNSNTQETAPTNKLTHLRWLMPTGEALSSELARQWLNRYPHIPLMNAYGPAECADDVAMWAINTPDQAQHDPMPIGKPTDNNRLYVLNDQLSLQPVGVPGELYVAGAGVGRGYLNDPERTKTAFLKNTLQTHPAHQQDELGKNALTQLAQPERLYKTGDLARWRADGVLEYLGRTDHQVKIRGFRIELGEIESVLQQQVEVKEAVVVAKTQQGNPMLVAYVVLEKLPEKMPADDGKEQELVSKLVSKLKNAIAETLPVYMQPAAFSVLEKLPLTPNGKVDRKALPDVDFTAQQKDYTAPRNALEQQICDIWLALLAPNVNGEVNGEANKESQIGIDDNFFELGGHSLLAVRLLTRLEKIGLTLTLPVLFQNPTIRQLAAASGVDALTVLHELRPALIDSISAGDSGKTTGTEQATPLFCVHHGGGHTRQYQALAQALPASVPVYGVQARSLIDSGYREVSICAMASDYLQEIQRVQPHGPYQLLGWSTGGIIALEIAAQLEQQGETVRFLSLIDTVLAKPNAGTSNKPDDNQPDIIADLLTLVDNEKQAMYHRLPAATKEQLAAELETKASNNTPEKVVGFALNWATQHGLFNPDMPEHEQRYLKLSGKTLLHSQQLLREHQVTPVNAPLTLCWAQQTHNKLAEKAGMAKVETGKARAEKTNTSHTSDILWAHYGQVTQEANSELSQATFPGGHYDLLTNPELFGFIGERLLGE